MQVITNQQFVRTRARLGKITTFLGFVALIGGFVAATQGSELLAASYLALIFGWIAITVGRYNLTRWAIGPREDEVLASSLKGLDQKHYLFNYHPRIPVEHLLLTPSGVFVLETRHQFGTITNQGDKWSQKRGLTWWLGGFADGGVGNPTRDARNHAEEVRHFVSQQLGKEEDGAQIPIHSFIVFTHPRATVQTFDPAVPVVTPQAIKNHIRSLQRQSRFRISPSQFRQLTQVAQ